MVEAADIDTAAASVTVKALAPEAFGAFSEFERSWSPVVVARPMAALSVTFAATFWC